MKARTATKWAIGVVALVIVICAGSVVWFFVAFYVSMEKGEEHRRQLQAEQDSGRWDFGDQPALFAVAQGIVKNDPAAKGVPELQAPGRDGTTLLEFAVRQSWQRPESVEALKTLLSLGADLNSAMPQDASDSAGYPLLVYRTAMGFEDNLAYADALLLLERGADPNRAGADGMTFSKMLMAHQVHFQRKLKPPPTEFAALWDWAEKLRIVQQTH